MAKKKTATKTSKASTEVVLNSLTPMICVKDIKKSIAFFKEVAGMDMLSPQHCMMDKGKMVWASIVNGQIEIMLTCKEPKSPKENNLTIYYFNVKNLDTLHGRLKKKYKVSPLRTTFYHMKEFDMKDLDGHTLWFGEPAPHGPDCQH